jgi:hypothetical protein
MLPLAPAADPGSRGRLAQLVATAVDDVAGVRRSSGTGVEVATQFRGGRVLGFRVAPERVTVSIVAKDVRVRDAADRVHDSVSRALLVAGQRRRVTVIVEDIDVALVVGQSW